MLLLLDVDHDGGLAALTALSEALTEIGAPYPHRFAAAPNSGVPTGVDLDGDGRSWRARDAHGYGLFTGQAGMAVLSRVPIGAVRDHSGLRWTSLPGNAAEGVTPEAARETLRLHSVAAWDVELLTPDGPLHLLASHASPPVFDGPEDRNGLRNADELRFWRLYLDGQVAGGPGFAPETPFVLAGTFNVDPERGEGRREAIDAILSDPRLQDPRPLGPFGAATADWDEPAPGRLRVDYILPSANLAVTGSAILWPLDGALADAADTASDHRLVWVDLDF